ncbi:MAG: aminotransferase class V-fold PLP-dependent enzyme [Actinomycetota bacterium]
MSHPGLDAHTIDAARAVTPGIDHVVHLNHAGSSLPSESVLEAQIAHLRLEAEIGGYEAAGAAADADAAVYDSIAELLGARAHEISRHEHATAAWNAGFWSIPMEAGQRIVTARAAYGANAVAFLRAAERRGVTVEVCPDDEHGQVDVSALEATLGDDVALVALTHVPTNGGLVNPAAEVGRLARAADVPFLLDACQSAGQVALDVDQLGCDLLSATGRKYLRGPRGTGFLYASDRIIDRLTPDHPDHHGADWSAHDQYDLADGARRFEHWEYNHAAWLGLGVAVREAISIGIPGIESTVAATAEDFRARLDDAGFRVRDLGRVRCGIVTIDCVDPKGRPFDGDRVKTALRAEAINVSLSSPSSTRFDAEARGLGRLMRLSAHYLTTDDELDRAVDALRRATA